ncbi:ATP-dependent helicase, partial [Streptomyces sp. SID7958]|nr:ATP-dependent helicase [Streptomyces sp. SID7958]
TDPAEADTAGTDPADADTARTHPTEADTARTHPTEADSAGTDLTGTGPAAGAAGEPGADAAVTADGAPVEGQAETPADTPVAPTATAGQAEDTCWLDTETALTLLTSPLAGMDAADLRRLGRALREEERATGNPLPPSSDVLLTRALAEPE